MIFDKALMLSEAQAVTNSAASTNYIDLGVARDIAPGESMEFFVNVATLVESGGSSTLTVGIQTDSDPAFGTVQTILTSPSVAKAALVAGYEFFKVKLPMGGLRYLRAYYTVGTADLTAGAFNCGLILDRRAHAYYASGLRTTGF